MTCPKETRYIWGKSTWILTVYSVHTPMFSWYHLKVTSVQSWLLRRTTPRNTWFSLSCLHHTDCFPSTAAICEVLQTSHRNELTYVGVTRVNYWSENSIMRSDAALKHTSKSSHIVERTWIMNPCLVLMSEAIQLPAQEYMWEVKSRCLEHQL